MTKKECVFLIFCLSALRTVLCFDNDVMFGDLTLTAAILMIIFFDVDVECIPLILADIATKDMNIRFFRLTFHKTVSVKIMARVLLCYREDE